MADAQESQAKHPQVPASSQNRISMKWLTVEALRVAIERANQIQPGHRAVFLIPQGTVEGDISEIRSSTAESYIEGSNDSFTADIASLTANIRTELLRLTEETEEDLQVIDSGAMIVLSNVKLMTHQGTQQLSQMTIFADQIIGFTTTEPTSTH